MPIVASEIKFYKSNESNSTGGTITATEVTDNTLNNLFDDVSAAEAESGAIEYRKIFVKNTNGSLTLSNIKIWISQLTSSSGDEFHIGLGSSSDTDGSAASYSQPTTAGAGLSVASLASGASQGLWIRRTVSAGASAAANDTGILSVQGETS